MNLWVQRAAVFFFLSCLGWYLAGLLQEHYAKEGCVYGEEGSSRLLNSASESASTVEFGSSFHCVAVRREYEYLYSSVDQPHLLSFCLFATVFLLSMFFLLFALVYLIGLDENTRSTSFMGTAMSSLMILYRRASLSARLRSSSVCHLRSATKSSLLTSLEYLE